MEELIKKIVFDSYGVHVDSQTLISEIVEDSLNKIEFIFELETQLKRSIPQDSILDIETFGDLVKALEK